MTVSPQVSVVMAVYNAEAFLLEAVRSVLAQSFVDLELVAIDDGSSDSSREILLSISDRRLRVLTNPSNLGFATSLNRGIAVARGPYIARLDADDVCARDRLSKQVAHLDANQRIAILGTAARVIGEGAARAAGWKVPQTALAVRFVTLLRCPFLHPTVMLRRAAFTPQELVYDPSFAPAEDYDLWSRALRSVDGANLTQRLVDYRIHGTQMTRTRRSGMLEAHDTIAHNSIIHELPHYQISRQQITNARRAFVGGEDGLFERLAAVRTYLDLFAAFAAAHESDPELDEVRRDVAENAMRILLPARRDATYFATLREIIKLDPAFPFAAFARRSRRALGEWTERKPRSAWEGERGS
jgi:glycosyltransferase involved in cell wall biosynthesis